MNKLEKEIVKRAEEKSNHTVVMLQLSGSWSANLAHSDSDKDYLLLVEPTKKDLMTSQVFAAQYKFDVLGEEIDLKVWDVRKFIELFRKTNFDVVQSLYADWEVLVPEFEQFLSVMRTHQQALANYDRSRLLTSMMGIIMYRLKRASNADSLSKGKHYMNYLRVVDTMLHLVSEQEVVKENFVASPKYREHLLAIRLNTPAYDTTELSEYVSELVSKNKSQAKTWGVFEEEFELLSNTLEKVVFERLLTFD